MLRKKKANSVEVFETYEIEYRSFKEFCKTWTLSGDWIINLGGKEKTHEDYDDRLVSVYHHQDDNLVLKDISKMKTIKYIPTLIGKLDGFFGKLNKKTVEKMVEKLQKTYDSKMTDNSGSVREVIIVIPMYDPEAKTGLLVRVIDRIVLVFI